MHTSSMDSTSDLLKEKCLIWFQEKNRCSHLGLLSSQPGFPSGCCAFTVNPPLGSTYAFINKRWHGSNEEPAVRFVMAFAPNKDCHLQEDSSKGCYMKNKTQMTLSNVLTCERSANQTDMHMGSRHRCASLRNSHSSPFLNRHCKSSFGET